MSTVSIIVAVGNNNAIGKDNDLLWRMPADMKRFKTLTTGHTILMGRKTFESLPKGALPNRTNVVLTSTANAQFPDCLTFQSLETALTHFPNEEELFIIGGASVYRQALAHADKLYWTQVHGTFPEADTFFPEVNWEEWKEIEREEYPADEKNAYPYTFLTYMRK